MSIIELKNDQEFKDALAKHSNYLVIALFSAKFVEKECQQMKDAVGELVKSAQPNSIVAFQLDADSGQATVKELKVECIPSVLLFANSKQVDKVEGTDVSDLVNKVKESIIKHYPLLADIGTGQTASNSSLDARLKQLINQNDLMIFMKGSKNAPRCGFSKQLIAILTKLEATYDTFDILTDEDVRQGLKTYSNWPTFPQIYHKGELIGGLDIIKEMIESGEFQDLIKS